MAHGIFQLKIVTQGLKPAIWRRALVSSHASLQTLHHIIMVLFGFESYHLFEFSDMGDTAHYNDIKLSTAFKWTPVLHYTYDFGDRWEFKITLEKTVQKNPSASYPCCIQFKGGMMLEDCGGEYGFKITSDWCRLKTVASKKILLDYYAGDEEMLEQYVDFNPDFFDLNDVNQALMTHCGVGD